MDKATTFSREDINKLFEQLDINVNETNDCGMNEYYNIWDFGKTEDETHGVISVNANLALLL